MILDQMREQWDEIAKRNAFYGVVSWPEFERLQQVDRAKFWETGRRDVDKFLERMGPEDTSSWAMVEIGCGLGRMTHRFAERFKTVYAVDVSPEMLKQAAQQWPGLPNVEFILGHGSDLPGVADRSIDFVFSFIVLQHVPDPDIVRSYIRETARVLKPGGKAYLQIRTDALSFWGRFVRAATHPRRALRTLITRIAARRAPSTGASTLADEFGAQYEAWRGCSLRPGEIDSFAHALGLRIDSVEGLGTPYTYYMFRKPGPLHQVSKQ